MLTGDEVYRIIKPVDLFPILHDFHAMQFVSVNQGGADTKRYPCDVVLSDKFTPALREFIEQLDLGGETARAILRRLSPFQSIPPHVDDWMPDQTKWRRFQVPIVSDPEIRMRWPDDGIEVYLEPGYLYEVRFDRLHEVNNSADVERVHLQIDQINATI